MSSLYHRFDDMCWPIPGERMSEIEWRLRQATPRLTEQDMVAAASIIAAYRQMIVDPHHKRVRVIRELRAAAGTALRREGVR